MKTPISYWGGKQQLAATILPLIPEHHLYVEPFCGGAAIFFAKEKSQVEVINDTNSEVINFYRVAQNDFNALEREISITLHSRQLHRNAMVMYENPHLFDPVKRAWALWTLATMGFSSCIGKSWGYGRKENTSEKKTKNKREGFSEEYAIRLQDVQIECADALRIITSRDTPTTFFYVDPPYYNSDCGHYDGYSEQDFCNLLDMLSKVEGKFLMSSYPSKPLTEFIKKAGWYSKEIEMKKSAGAGTLKSGKAKTKVEVLTANYPI